MYAAGYGHVEAVKSLVAADPDPAHLDMEVSKLLFTVSKGVFVVYERQREAKRVHSDTGRDTETVVY